MRIALSVIVALLSGCAQNTQPAPATAVSGQPAPSGFACPKVGTAVKYAARARPVVSEGPDAADPMLCRLKLPNGKTVGRYANVYESPPGQDDAVRQGMAELFPLVPGKRVRFSLYRGYTNDPTRRDRQDETWTVGERATLKVGGQTIETIKVVQQIDQVQGWTNNGWRWTYDYDPATGTWLRGDPELLRGEVRGLTPFMAVSLVVP